jgi:nucleotide-binding universal stress UspA family protein
MHEHILVPTDGSELSNQAVEYAVALAKAVNAKVTVVAVSIPEFSAAIAARNHLDVAKDIAAASQVACDALHIEHSHPYQAIIDTANNRGCDLIVMASHGRSGIAAIILGSETVKVLTHSTIPVLVVRPKPSPLAFLKGS